MFGWVAEEIDYSLICPSLINRSVLTYNAEYYYETMQAVISPKLQDTSLYI
jgi:hypothetical protein